jgi:polar amino acid transport system ATP-binding protein
MDQGRVIETAAPEAFFRTPQTDRARQFLLRYAAGQLQEAAS